SVEQTLPERIGQRLYSRITEMCEIIEIEGPDARTAIHKAGMDFKKRPSTQEFVRIPAGMLFCPRCESPQVRVLDQASAKGSGSRQYSEISCLCQQCSEHFLARFFPRTAKLEYPSSTDH
ncbi:MAG: hypothetical protein ACWGQW_12620, partial [bacterium]